jgi:homocysteine S-methyltransferase
LDLIAFETVPSLSEAKVIIELINEEKPEKLIWISFSCKNTHQTCAGDEFSECVELISHSKLLIWGLGINCTNPFFVKDLLTLVPKNFPKMVIVYPNSGEIYEGQRQIWLSSETKQLTDKNEIVLFEEKMLNEWKERRANIIGGCCRTTPETIKAISNFLQNKKKMT